MRRVIENALKATIADLIMLGIARKPFLNAVNPLIIEDGIPFIEAILQFFNAIVDLDIFAGSSVKLLIKPTFKSLLIRLKSALKPKNACRGKFRFNLFPALKILKAVSRL